MNKTEKTFNLRIMEDFLGTVPKDPSIYATYIASKAPETSGEEEVESCPQESELKGWTGFHADEQGIFIYDYMVKGFLKNAGNILKSKHQVDIKNLQSKVNKHVFIFPRRLRFFNADGSMVREAQDVLERPVRITDKSGTRVAIVRSDVVKAGAIIRCEVEVLDNDEISMDTIDKLMEYGRYQGLGQWRNASYGRFEVV